MYGGNMVAGKCYCFVNIDYLAFSFDLIETKIKLKKSTFNAF